MLAAKQDESLHPHGDASKDRCPICRTGAIWSDRGSQHNDKKSQQKGVTAKVLTKK